jgi:hypothetical protein
MKSVVPRVQSDKSECEESWMRSKIDKVNGLFMFTMIVCARPLLVETQSHHPTVDNR